MSPASVTAPVMFVSAPKPTVPLNTNALLSLAGNSVARSAPPAMVMTPEPKAFEFSTLTMLLAMVVTPLKVERLLSFIVVTPPSGPEKTSEPGPCRRLPTTTTACPSTTTAEFVLVLRTSGDPKSIDVRP